MPGPDAAATDPGQPALRLHKVPRSASAGRGIFVVFGPLYRTADPHPPRRVRPPSPALRQVDIVNGGAL